MYQSKKEKDKKFLGSIPVSTGTICISDPAYILDAISLPIHLQKMVKASEEGEYGIEFQKKVLVNTSEDGTFDIYAEYDEIGAYEPSRFIIELS